VISRRLRAIAVASFVAIGMWTGATVAPTRAQSGDEEPWTIEGEALRGSRVGGTELDRPRITQGPLVITAVSGRLDASRDVLYLRDSLLIVDETREVEAEEGIYRRSLRRLDLTGAVRGKGPEGRFTAGRLIHDRARGLLQLRDSPFVADSLRDVWARAIDYDDATGLATADGDVRVFVRADSTWITGRQATLDRTRNRIVIVGDPRVERSGGARDGALVVLADTLIFDDGSGRGEARGHVRIERGGIRARGANAEFEAATDRIFLWGDPIAWESSGVIWADTLVVQQGAGGADWLRALGSVRVRYRADGKPDEENLLLGDTLVARLSEDTLSDLEVHGDAVSVFLPSWVDVLAGSGRNLSTAREIRVDLARGRAVQIELQGDGVGLFLYPSETSRGRLRRDGLVDSLRTATADTMSASVDTIAPTLSRALAYMARERTLDLPDSLRAPSDSLFDERVEYQGDTIRFLVDSDRLVLLGRGEIRYQGSSLTAPRIEYLAENDLVRAEGGAVLKDASGEVKGERMTYRTDEQEGFVYQGRTAFEGGFYRGAEIKKLSDEALLVRDGDYTTCENDPPHYEFHSSRMKIIQGDKVVARPVILRILGIPVLALPFWVFPIEKGRQSGILLPDVEVGFNRNRGRFFRNLGYYWAISDHMDARAWVDYYERDQSLDFNGNYRYRVRYLLDGTLNATYGDDRTPGQKRRRYSVQGAHQQELGEGATLTGRADFTSDLRFRGDRDFGASIDEQLNRTLRSDLALRKNWQRANLSAEASRVEYLDATTGSGVKVQQSLPAVDFSLGQRALGRAPDERGRHGRLPILSSVYLSSTWAYRNLYTKRYDGTTETNQAVSERHSLSDTRRLGPYLRLSPSIQMNAAAFERDNLGRRHRAGATWSGSAQASTAFYGTFPIVAGPLAGMRHVVEPSASYSYSPEFPRLNYADSLGVERSRFPNVGGISLGGSKVSSVGLSLSQRLHLKFRRGDKVWKRENVATWSTSSGYNFEATHPIRPWSSIANSLRVRPGSRMDVSLAVSHGAYDLRPQNFSVDTAFRLDQALFRRAPQDSATAGAGVVGGAAATESPLEYGEFGQTGLSGANLGNRGRTSSTGAPWRISIGHSYRTSRGADRPTHTANLGLDNLLATGHWSWSGSVYFDLEEQTVTRHSFSLGRDLHCWEARFEYRSSGGQSEYYFRIAVKDLPELQYERDQR